MTEEQYKSALLLAGRLALKAQLVVWSSAKNLSKRIDELETALNEYDNFIFSLGSKEEQK